MNFKFLQSSKKPEDIDILFFYQKNVRLYEIFVRKATIFQEKNVSHGYFELFGWRQHGPFPACLHFIAEAIPKFPIFESILDLLSLIFP